MFHFDLGSVLNLRVQEEEQCRLIFADVLRNLQMAQKDLADLRLERENRIKYFAEIWSKSIPSQTLRTHYYFLEQLKYKEDKQAEYVRRIEKDAEDKREQLLSAMKKKKAMEMLREKKLMEYLRNAAAKDSRNLDELAVTRYEKRSDE